LARGCGVSFVEDEIDDGEDGVESFFELRVADREWRKRDSRVANLGFATTQSFEPSWMSMMRNALAISSVVSPQTLRAG
jgi:hypothetical protein